MKAVYRNFDYRDDLATLFAGVLNVESFITIKEKFERGETLYFRTQKTANNTSDQIVEDRKEVRWHEFFETLEEAYIYIAKTHALSVFNHQAGEKAAEMKEEIEGIAISKTEIENKPTTAYRSNRVNEARFGTEPGGQRSFQKWEQDMAIRKGEWTEELTLEPKKIKPNPWGRE